MDHFLYIAASGARETMLAQGVNSHNLANASTPGFRADLLLAQSALVDGEGHKSRIYSTGNEMDVDLDPGVVSITGRDLDVAINGPGWIAVQTPEGKEVYSRRGDLRVDEFGQLSDGAGLQLIGNSGPIALPPFSDITIGTDGTISIVPLGEAPNTLAVIDRIKLVNPERSDLRKTLNGLIELKKGDAVEADAGVSLIAGSLESSNVNAVSAMVTMIELSREFEAHARMMKTAEQLDSASAQLMSMS
ncbi:MAG: flagellar basal body rod protein FlgF [Porticoccaceae bacterium]|nr:flagellar basal body rod protein FlgF [Pseudomonadales bacterium]MCP5173010.1 flagellar basal body rod protein FlgF [Pseudomonadales bacterium]MCP5302483.1 flagellar basal body rod protein FlgF [Pseudomonadales bacterium]